MYVIVGLGNPGEKYERTFHNCGFMTVDVMLQKLGKKMNKTECRAKICELYSGGEKVLLCQPTTYMNPSGECVRELMSKYDCHLENLLVIYDDFDLPAGALRLRETGSAGTHNGMRNVIACLGTQNVRRIRIGAGRPETENFEAVDYVLSDIPKSMRERMFTAFIRAADAAIKFFSGSSFSDVMQEYNRNYDIN